MSVLSEPFVRDALCAAAVPRRTGRVSRLVGLRLEVEGLEAAAGDAVWVRRSDGSLLATEVLALREGTLACVPLGELSGVRYGDAAETAGRPLTLTVGEGLLGRVLDGLGRPIDDGPPLSGGEQVPFGAAPPHPLRRDMVDRPISLGVRAIDTAVPCGRGQRLGIFAGSGVGKSSLLSMIARGTDAQVSVVTLIGERGREVAELVRRDLHEALSRSVVVVATSDQPALVRLRAAFAATRIAEWFRDQGNDVVLMMDSLTRFAMAQREVALSAGEPPATRGYPPSVFALLPRLLERAGAAERGSITALYTVLVEGDDMDEPVADAARAILDGHIVLSRRLATAGHFPSIDVLDSISRVAPAVTSPGQQALARELRRLLGAYRDARDLVEIGAYVKGSNPLVDRALELHGAIETFLRQEVGEISSAEEAWSRLTAVLAPPGDVAGARAGGAVA